MKSTTHHSADSLIEFSIDHLDTLAQGVCKSGADITFIAKTLPNEMCSARIFKEKKGVRFAKLHAIQQPAINRIAAECTHYAKCPGCHYLHTDYDSELNYKRRALARHLHHLNINPQTIDVVAAPDRFSYRNRIQLHYQNMQLGFIDSSDDSIVEIPHCKIIREELRESLNTLYKDRKFPQYSVKHKQRSKQKNNKGHCEIYLKSGEAQLSWNKAYADGGFSQVNEAVNQLVLNSIFSLTADNGHQNILDLFSGSGNLSQLLHEKNKLPRTMVDNCHLHHVDFQSMNLYATDALKKFMHNNQQHYDLILLDPPRAGFPALQQWITTLRPKQLIYLSCYPASLARDLKSLDINFNLEKIMLFDMFPGTQHFETLLSLKF